MKKYIHIVNELGENISEFALEDKWLEQKKGIQAIHDVVVAYRAGLRAGTASTKTRAQVRGGGVKPFRQKGTGKARAGSIRSPIWVGGGVAFGPHPRSFEKKVNKKVMKLALKRTFSDKIKESSVLIISKLNVPNCKTKNTIEILKNLKLNKKVLILVKEYDQNLLKSTNNIANILLMKTSSVNVYELLNCNKVLFSEEGIKDFVCRL